MGGGVKLPKVPHHTHYNWQDIPELVKHQERLAEHGLRDPWARNHVWKFINPATNNGRVPWYMFWTVNYPVQRGFAIGMAALGIYIAFDKLTSSGEKEHH